MIMLREAHAAIQVPGDSAIRARECGNGSKVKE